MLLLVLRLVLVLQPVLRLALVLVLVLVLVLGHTLQLNSSNMQQQALVGVIRNQELPTNLGYMARVFARLESLSQDAPLQELWQIASGLIEGLANGSVSHGASVRTLLRQIDKELKGCEQKMDEIFKAKSKEILEG